MKRYTPKDTDRNIDSCDLPKFEINTSELTKTEENEYTAADGASEDERYSSYVRDDNTVPNSGMEQTNFNGGLKFLTGEQGVLRIDAEVVRTKDVGFPGFSLETNNIEFTFPNFDRDKIGVAWNSGPVCIVD